LRTAPKELIEKEGKIFSKKIKSSTRNELCNGLRIPLNVALMLFMQKKE
jgi:hypothetical protein